MNDKNQIDGPNKQTLSQPNMLKHYGQWLLSIPRDDIASLMETPEYQLFNEAFQKLEVAHRQTVLQNQQSTEDTTVSSIGSNNKARRAREVSFLQHLALDDMILRIFEFLPCDSLIRTSETCYRFHILGKRSAKQRTINMAGRFYLQSEMKLLRAKEQIEGIRPNCKPIVRVPLLGLSRRIYVTGSGDEEFNGIYFCTGSNGNGFLFTKPRNKHEWTRQDSNNIMMEVDMDVVDVDEELDLDADHNDNDVDFDHFPNHVINNGAMRQIIQPQNNHNNHHHHHHHNLNNNNNNDNNNQQQILHHQNNHNNGSFSDEEGEETYPLSCSVKVPRCIISKRFSNEVCTMYTNNYIIEKS